jgi:hypothetical protein
VEALEAEAPSVEAEAEALKILALPHHCMKYLINYLLVGYCEPDVLGQRL